MLLIPAEGDCAEFTYFKLTDVEGNLKLGYSLNETKLTQSSGSGSFEKRPAWQQELELTTRSYLFHPNLVEMELDGGVRFEQEELMSDLGTQESRDAVYNFNGRWSFLKYKPYPFNLYYTQSHPTKAVGIADVLTVETRSYGAAFFLRQPVISTPISLYADHSENKGDSSSNVIDDTTDSLTLGVMINIADNGTGQLGFSRVSKKSASGSTSLPLVESESDTDSFDWTGRLAFGRERNVELTNYLLLTRDTQSNAMDRDRANFYNYLNWKVDKALELYNTYTFAGTSYEQNRSKNHNMTLGLTDRLSDAWDVTSSLEASREESTGFTRLTDAVSGGFNYRDEISDRWISSAGYTAQYRLTTQLAEQSTVSVFDESHVLVGLTAVALGHELVVPGSVSVSNLSHTQTYVENIDYRLTVVGTETRLERLASGNIADGDTVLVDYIFELNGSYDYKEVNQTLNLTYTLDRRYDFFMNYSLSRPMLQSGTPVRNLVSVERYRFGIDAQVPLNNIMEYGWGVEYERRIDELNPFQRSTLDLSFDTGLPFYASIASLTAGYEHVDNELSPIDVREARYTAALVLRPGWGSIARFELSYRRDTGGDDLKSLADAALQYSWQRGRLDFSMVGKYSEERQGETTRNHTKFEATLVRHFR